MGIMMGVKKVVNDVMGDDERHVHTCEINIVKTNVLMSGGHHPEINHHQSMVLTGIPRDILFNIIANYKDLAITQESLRRVKLTELPVYHIGDEFKTTQFNEYLRLVEMGESKLEDARNELPADVSCNVVLSGYKNLMERVLDDILLQLSCAGMLATIERDTVPAYCSFLTLDGVAASECIIGDITTAIVGTSMVYRKTKEEVAELDWKYIANIIDLGHYSVLEHIPVVFTSNLSIAATTQLIRHRHMISKKNVESNNETDTLGTKISMTHYTNMREFISICSERNCSRAQTEIRAFSRMLRNYVISINDYRFMAELLGPKCTIECTGKICLQPCENYGKEI